MKKWPWFVVSLVVVLLDQGSKYWASISLLPYQSKTILPMLNLTLAYNTGAAFSFLSNSGGWQRWLFSGFSLVMSVILVVWILRSTSLVRMQFLALSLILGGAVGNLIDRFMAGYVIDFIDVYYKNHHWPVFNLADSAICLGAFLIFVDLCKNPRS